MYISTGKTMTPRAVPVEKRQKKSPTRDVASFTSPFPPKLGLYNGVISSWRTLI